MKCKFYHSNHSNQASEVHRPVSHAQGAPAANELDIASVLPSPSSEKNGLIPVNKDGQRIDTALGQPSEAACEAFRTRTHGHKLCNGHHLMNYCSNITCDFDHAPITEEVRLVLRTVARSIPCARKSDCRRANCTKGHICQKKGCRGGGGCKLNSYMHSVDPIVVEWIIPDAETGLRRSTGIHNGSSHSETSSRALSVEDDGTASKPSSFEEVASIWKPTLTNGRRNKSIW